VLGAVLLACGAPDQAPDDAPRASAASRSDSARAPVPSVAADAYRPPNDTNYLEATERTDPDSIVNGWIPNAAVLDSVFLGRRGGARVTALLVRLGPGRDPDYGWHRVYEVESSDSGRVVRATELEALGSVPRSEAGFGAVDVDGDGMREPYIGHWSGGTQGYIAEVDLLVPGRRHPHWYMLEGFYGDLESRRGDFESAPPRPPRVQRWMTAHVQRVADAADPNAHHPRMIHYHADVRQWVRDHGADFRQGPVRVRWHAGPVPTLWEGTCRTREGDLEWVMVGGIWGYDRARGRHFLLRPHDRYTRPDGIVLGARYLWLGSTAPAGDGYGLLAYDRAARRMTVIPVAGLRPRARSGCEGVCSGPELSVRGSRLYGDTVPLALPDSIVPAVEFADTGRVCPRRRGRSE
jgi:hypothetical protein